MTFMKWKKNIEHIPLLLQHPLNWRHLIHFLAMQVFWDLLDLLESDTPWKMCFPQRIRSEQCSNPFLNLLFLTIRSLCCVFVNFQLHYIIEKRENFYENWSITITLLKNIYYSVIVPINVDLVIMKTEKWIFIQNSSKLINVKFRCEKYSYGNLHIQYYNTMKPIQNIVFFIFFLYSSSCQQLIWCHR